MLSTEVSKQSELKMWNLRILTHVVPTAVNVQLEIWFLKILLPRVPLILELEKKKIPLLLFISSVFMNGVNTSWSEEKSKHFNPPTKGANTFKLHLY